MNILSDLSARYSNQSAQWPAYQADYSQALSAQIYSPLGDTSSIPLQPSTPGREDFGVWPTYRDRDFYNSAFPYEWRQVIGFPLALAERRLEQLGAQKILLQIPRGGSGGNYGILGGPEFAFRARNGSLYTMPTDGRGLVQTFSRIQARPRYNGFTLQQVDAQLRSEGYRPESGRNYYGPPRYRSADGRTILTVSLNGFWNSNTVSHVSVSQGYSSPIWPRPWGNPMGTPPWNSTGNPQPNPWFQW